MVRFYRNKNIFWSWIDIKICFSVEVYKHRKKSIHIFSSQRICRSLWLKCMLMRGLCINIQIFWVSFLWAHSLVEKFCGELKKRLKQPFPPFSENIFTGAPLPLSYESYTKKKKKPPHELCVCVWWEGEGEGGRGGSMSAAVKVKSLNPFAEGELNQ